LTYRCDPKNKAHQSKYESNTFHSYDFFYFVFMRLTNKAEPTRTDCEVRNSVLASLNVPIRFGSCDFHEKAVKGEFVGTCFY
jgi:hypothetical protein